MWIVGKRGNTDLGFWYGKLTKSPGLMLLSLLEAWFSWSSSFLSSSNNLSLIDFDSLFKSMSWLSRSLRPDDKELTWSKEFLTFCRESCIILCSSFILENMVVFILACWDSNCLFMLPMESSSSELLTWSVKLQASNFVRRWLRGDDGLACNSATIKLSTNCSWKSNLTEQFTNTFTS